MKDERRVPTFASLFTKELFRNILGMSGKNRPIARGRMLLKDRRKCTAAWPPTFKGECWLPPHQKNPKKRYQHFEMMKAAMYTRYGGPEVLEIKETAIPVLRTNEILIRIHATAVNSGDCRLRKADPFAVRFFFGLFGPRKKILGNVLSGQVEKVGSQVTGFQPGDQVFGATQMHMGAYAELVSLPATAPLASKPDRLGHHEAAALIFGGMTALHFLRKAAVKPGQRVLIYGASGAVGTAAVQLAKYFGAEVTAVCSEANMDLVRSLGADHVIDYTKKGLDEAGGPFDLIYETVNKAPFHACMSVLKPGGQLILGAALLGGMLRGAWANLTSDKKVITGVAEETAEAASFLAQRAVEGSLRAVIDREYPLDQIVEAHRYADGGHKKGNVVIRVI